MQPEEDTMKILLVYPETPSTFYGFRHALKFISKRSDGPPLGLLTVAAMLPSAWDVRLIDLNVSKLTDKDISRVDYVFLSGMDVQRESFMQVIRRCNQLGVKVVAGGPFVTSHHEEILGVDHFVLNEAEITLPQFIRDLENGHPKHRYSSDEFPDIAHTPLPRWDLLKMKHYATMYVQYSRGCPFNCEFCSITSLFGHRVRTKDTYQFLGELEDLYQRGWRGGVFVVDDNFIGNRSKLKTDLLPAMIEWSRSHRHPFDFTTEASINLADDDELAEMMVEAGFNSVFVGIETVSDESLAECGKTQNRRRDMVASVRKLHRIGLRVSAGFIIGFDNDPPYIFEQMAEFIQNSSIVTAMVGLLNAPKDTRLARRLQEEKRLLNTTSGNNMDGSINFVPKMDYQKLVQGYKNVLSHIYSPKEYYQRVTTFLREYGAQHRPRAPKLSQIKALFRSMWVLGVCEKGKRYYWKLFLTNLFLHPKRLSLAITMAVYGFHFRRIVANV